MDKIFKPSAFDNASLNHVELDKEESIIVMRNLIYKMNQKLLGKGAKFKFIDPYQRWKREEIKCEAEENE